MFILLLCHKCCYTNATWISLLTASSHFFLWFDHDIFCSIQPTRQPSALPSCQPSSQPSAQPVVRPTGGGLNSTITLHYYYINHHHRLPPFFVPILSFLFTPFISSLVLPWFMYYPILFLFSVMWLRHLSTPSTLANRPTILSTKQPTQCTAFRASINATKCTAEWATNYASICTTHLPTNTTSMSFLLLLLSSHVHRLNKHYCLASFSYHEHTLFIDLHYTCLCTTNSQQDSLLDSLPHMYLQLWCSFSCCVTSAAILMLLGSRYLLHHLISFCGLTMTSFVPYSPLDSQVRYHPVNQAANQVHSPSCVHQCNQVYSRVSSQVCVHLYNPLANQRNKYVLPLVVVVVSCTSSYSYSLNLWH